MAAVRLEDLGGEADGRRYSPSAARNKGEILPVLSRYVPDSGLVLELACGTGEHAVHFATAFEGLEWQPSDRDREALASAAAWRMASGLARIRPPIELDFDEPWPIARADFVLAINVFHITAWASCKALLRGAASILEPGARLFVYGPFVWSGRVTAPSNLDFDARLRETNPDYGLREVESLDEVARQHGLGRETLVEMPNNNLSLIYRRL